MHFNTEAVDVVSNNKDQMSGILLKKADTGEESVLEVKGLFYGIGHSPNSQLLKGQIELDNAGYVVVKDGSAETSRQGVFAAGDVQVQQALIKQIFLEIDIWMSCGTACHKLDELMPYLGSSFLSENTIEMRHIYYFTVVYFYLFV